MHLRLKAQGRSRLDHLLNVGVPRNEDGLLRLRRRPNADELRTQRRPLNVAAVTKMDRRRSGHAQPTQADLRNVDNLWNVGGLLRVDGLLNADAPIPDDPFRVDHQPRHNDLSGDGQLNGRNLRDPNHPNVHSVVAHQHNAAVRLRVSPDQPRKLNK